MKIYSFLSLAAFVIYLEFFGYILWRNPRAKVNRAFAYVCLSLIIWSFACIFYYTIPENSIDEIWMWDKIASIGFCLFPSLCLYFFLILTNNNHFVCRWVISPFLHLMGTLFIIKSWQGNLLVKEWVYTEHYWFYNSNSSSIWFWLFNFYMIIALSIGLVVILKWEKESKTRREHQQAWIIIISLLIFSFTSLLTNVIFPALQIRIFPTIANILSLILISGIGYTVVKYKLMIINPQIAANALISNMNELLLFIDLQGKIINTNNFTLQTLGYNKIELVQKNMDSFFLGKKKVRTKFGDLLQTFQPQNFNTHLISKSREAIPVNFSLAIVKDDFEDILGAVMVGHDISQTRQLQKEINERKKVERELLAQRDKLNTINNELEKTNRELEKLSIIVRETDNSVVVLDKNGSLEWVNEGFVRLYGYSLDEFKLRKGDNIIKASDHKKIEEFFNRCVINKETVVYDIKNETKSIGYKWVQTSLTPIVKDGNIDKIIAVETDITDIKKAEEEIIKKNDEIIMQRDELEATHKILKQTFEAIKTKNKDITDSIIYAQKIQQAILPAQNKIKRLLPEHFILHRPKDIVSGDFYWVDSKDDKVLFAVVDCTGHGVPGAFMSIVGHNLLKQAINEHQYTKPGKILNFLSQGVYNTLRLNSDDFLMKDGMDLALCAIDFKMLKLQYAGAYNPLFVLRNNQILEFKADNYPIGDPFTPEFTGYHNIEIQLQKEDVIYIFSDGYIDQFGGKNRKKFSTKRFRKVLLDFHKLPMQSQKTKLLEVFEDWMEGYDQYDDVLVMAVKI